jgi:hypothetical protein
LQAGGAEFVERVLRRVLGRHCRSRNRSR